MNHKILVLLTSFLFLIQIPQKALIAKEAFYFGYKGNLVKNEKDALI